MKIIKRKSTITYEGKDKKEHYYYNYYLVLDNGNSICIKPSFTKDYSKLDTIAFYEK